MDERGLAVAGDGDVPGDPKGEWAPVADAVGGVVVRLRSDGKTRLNPLDAHGVDSDQAHGPRLRLLTALAEATRRTDREASASRP